MFELKRSVKIVEDIKLGDEIIKLDLDVDSIATNFRSCQVDLARAERRLKELRQEEADQEQAIVDYGNALIALLTLVFGEANTAKILKFYEDNYIELSLQILPFLADKIIPAIAESLQATKKQISQRYKANKRRFK